MGESRELIGGRKWGGDSACGWWARDVLTSLCDCGFHRERVCKPLSI